MGVKTQKFGALQENSLITEFILTNNNGIEVRLIDYGATITSIKVPDKDGKFDNVVLGFRELMPYLKNPFFIGSTIGRYCNRIRNSRFMIGDTDFILDCNNGKNHLHGGVKGFDKVKWTGKEISANSVVFTYLSPDGEMGYPGNLAVKVKFTLTSADELEINYSAITDKTTHVNLTNHSYFNLTANPLSTILEHELWINADHYTPVDNQLIPTGEIESVKNTPLDFTKREKIGNRINILEKGYDHNFLLNSTLSEPLLAASLYDDTTKRKMDVFTTEPGLQFYSGHYLNGFETGAGNIELLTYSALCLETQHFPNSPNEPSFPSTLLHPKEVYQSITKYKFSIEY